MIGPGNIDIEISSPIFFWEGGKGGGFLTPLYKKDKLIYEPQLLKKKKTKQKGKKNVNTATEHSFLKKEKKGLEKM